MTVLYYVFLFKASGFVKIAGTVSDMPLRLDIFKA